MRYVSFFTPSESNRMTHSFPIYFVRLCSMPVDLELWTPMKREKKASVFVEKWKFNMFFVLKRMLIRRETRGIGKEWAVWLGSLGLLKQYNLTFLDVKFCVWMNNPFKNCWIVVFLSKKNSPIGTWSFLSFFLENYVECRSQCFWIPGFCATAICTKELWHLEINKGFLYQLFYGTHSCLLIFLYGTETCLFVFAGAL